MLRYRTIYVITLLTISNHCTKKEDADSRNGMRSHSQFGNQSAQSRCLRKDIRAATEELKSCAGTSRIGVWLEPSMDAAERDDSLVFRGLVWDRESEGLPKEWTRLSADAPLPRELLNSGKSVDWSSGGPAFEPLLGPLLKLQGLLAAEESAGNILMYLAASCTNDAPESSAGAVFALIGERLGGLPVPVPSDAGDAEQLVVLG